MRRLSVVEERFALVRSFRIARGSKSHADVVVVTIAEGDRIGRGEGVPMPATAKPCGLMDFSVASRLLIEGERAAQRFLALRTPAEIA